MKGYKIEGAHYIDYFQRYENGKTITIPVHVWCADDECFDNLTDMIYRQGAYYIRAKHNAETDGKGNAWNGEEWVVPEHFYKTIEGRSVKVDRFTDSNPSTTKSGVNRTWMLESFYYVYNKYDYETVVPCLMMNLGRNGKVDTDCVMNAAMSTEASAKAYMKSHPNKITGMVTLIDWLARK